MIDRGSRSRRIGEDGERRYDPFRYVAPKPPANDDRRPLKRRLKLAVLKILILAAVAILLITAVTA